MKKNIFAIVMLMLMSSFVLFGGIANNPFDALTKVAILKNNEIIKVICESEKPGDTKVTITDENGLELFTETIKKEAGFIRPYNFSQLPYGQYTIEVENSQGQYIETINYSTEKDSERQDTELPAFVSRINEEPRKYLLSLPNTDENEITISLFDSNSELVYSNKEKIAGDFARIYHLKAFPDGEVTFHVKDQTGARKIIRID